MTQLGQTDYLIITIFITLVCLLGFFVSRRQFTLKDYFLAGGNIPWWAVSISLYASLLTPMSFVGVTGWVYQKDSRWFVGSSFVGVLSVYFAARIWIPIWSRLRPISIYGYLEQRFSSKLRIVGAMIFILQMIFWLGNELVTTASSFERATHFSGLSCLLVVVAVSTLYTLVGGARADIWTDIAQFTVFSFAFLIMGLLLLTYFHWNPELIHTLASQTASTVTGQPHTRMISTEYSLGIEGTIWAVAFARMNSVLTFGAEQVPVQRLLAIKSRKQIYTAMFGFTLIDLVVTMLTVFVAWGMVAFYQANPMVARPDFPDQVLVSYIFLVAPPFVRGLVMAALLGALMASYGTAVNSVSSVIVNDCYRRYCSTRRTEAHYLFISRLATLVMTIILLLFACWQYKHREITALQRVGQLSAVIAGPVACFFILGVVSRRANTPGVLIGGMCALLFSLVFNGVPGLFASLIAGVNWMWIGGLSTATGVIIGYCASFLFPPEPQSHLNGLTLARIDDLGE